MTALRETPARPESRELQRLRDRNRTLATIVIVLALALIGLGAWFVYDWTATPEAGMTPEVEAVFDNYLAAWNEGDVDAFMSAVADEYRFEMEAVSAYREADTVASELSAESGWQIEVLGEPLMIGDGPQYLVVAANRITENGLPDTYGISQITFFESGDEIEVLSHLWVER